MKNFIIQVTYFLNGPMSNLFFDFDIVLYQEKVTYEKFSHNLILEIQIVWRISAF